MNALKDYQLVAYAKAGQQNALAELYRRYAKKTLYLAFRITGSVQAAEEVRQEVWFKVCVHIKGFREESSFSTWLFEITRNTALNFKKHNSHLSLSEDDENMGFLEWKRFSGTDHNNIYADIALREVVSFMPASYQRLMVLQDEYGVSLFELSELLGISHSILKNASSFARKFIRAKLNGHPAKPLPKLELSRQRPKRKQRNPRKREKG
ncbi:MAG TPA: RNA polymerase sigma factor [Patescibacteria group bacterium]|nr:RNA polymerase sigma factor [Patescibacteria group bacterium]